MRTPLLPPARVPVEVVRRRRLVGLRLLAAVFVCWIGAVALLNWLGSLLP